MQSNRDSVTTPLPPWLQAKGDRFSLEVHVQPGARRTAITGEHGGRLKIAVTAPAESGQANAAVLRLIAAALDVSASAVTLAAGGTSRRKRVEVAAALTAAHVAALSPPQ